ncbi:MAG: hypothetical protein RML45_00025 [Acetobacteraceae bacterium]|nr:hypothetical protein [Acetobacteraceae bacterium]
MLDVQPALARVAEALDAVLVGRGELQVGALVLGVGQPMLERGLPVEGGLDAVVHPAALDVLHGAVVVQVHDEAHVAVGVGGGVDDDAHRGAADGDFHPALGGQRPVLPERDLSLRHRLGEGLRDVDGEGADGGGGGGRRRFGRCLGVALAEDVEGQDGVVAGEDVDEGDGLRVLGRVDDPEVDLHGVPGREVRAFEGEDGGARGAVGVGVLDVHLDGDDAAADLGGESLSAAEGALEEGRAEGGETALERLRAGVLDFDQYHSVVLLHFLWRYTKKTNFLLMSAFAFGRLQGFFLPKLGLVFTEVFGATRVAMSLERAEVPNARSLPHNGFADTPRSVRTFRAGAPSCARMANASAAGSSSFSQAAFTFVTRVSGSRRTRPSTTAASFGATRGCLTASSPHSPPTWGRPSA